MFELGGHASRDASGHLHRSRLKDAGEHPFPSAATYGKVPGMAKPLSAYRHDDLGRRSVEIEDHLGLTLSQAHELEGSVARLSDERIGIVEGVSLVVRMPEGQLRALPVEAVERFSAGEQEVTIRTSIEPHGFPRHRSLRRLGDRWRVDVSLDVPRMDADYWLVHCHGFHVNSPNEKVGVVDEVIFDARGYPETLLVRAGGFRGQTFALAIDEVIEIIPELRTIGIQGDVEGAHESKRRDGG